MTDASAAATAARTHLDSILKAELEVVDGQDAHVNIYALPVPLNECWVVYVPRTFRGLIRSSEVVIIEKTSGAVVYHGSAFDEG
jgi:hypothetical protein